MKPKGNVMFYHCFAGLISLHGVLFVAIPFLLPDFDARIRLFSVNVLPWWPLHQLGLPVTRHGWLVMPNAAGYIWCLVVWLGTYAALAFTCGRLIRRSGAPPGKRDAA